MSKLLFSGLMSITAITIALYWNRTQQVTTAPLIISRITPRNEGILRGPPNDLLQVELEVKNTTRQPIELAPLRMSCSCQIATSPEKVIAAGASTKLVLSLRYPPARRNNIPVEFKTPTGQLLARTDIVLEADIKLPYFLLCPDVVEIPIVDGVSELVWRTSAIALEDVLKPPHIQRAHVTLGSDQVRITMESAMNSQPGMPDGQRTYQFSFEVLEPALRSSPEAPPTRGIAILELSDGTDRVIPWSVSHQLPLALVYDSKAEGIRGVRRAGAQGKVKLRAIPEGSGTFIPDQFDSGVPVIAKLKSGASKLVSVEALYEGTQSAIPVLVAIP